MSTHYGNSRDHKFANNTFGIDFIIALNSRESSLICVVGVYSCNSYYKYFPIFKGAM